MDAASEGPPPETVLDGLFQRAETVKPPSTTSLVDRRKSRTPAPAGARRLASLALIAIAILVAGCGEAGDETRGAKDTTATKSAASKSAEQDHADAGFGYVPDGFELARDESLEDDPRGRPPGVSAFLLHSRDCCRINRPETSLSYPPSLILRKFDSDDTMREVAAAVKSDALEVANVQPESIRIGRERIGDLDWISVTFTVYSAQLPLLRGVRLVNAGGGETREVNWILADIDKPRFDGDLRRLVAEVEWPRIRAIPPEEIDAATPAG